MNDPVLQPFIFNPQSSWDAIDKIISVFQDLGVFKANQPSVTNRSHEVDQYTRLFGGYNPSEKELAPGYVFMSSSVKGLGNEFIDFFEHGKGMSLSNVVITESLETTYGLICMLCDKRLKSNIFFPLLEDRLYRWHNGDLRRPTKQQIKDYDTACDSETDLELEHLALENQPLRPAMPQEITGKLIQEGKLDIRSQKYVFSENRIISLS